MLPFFIILYNHVAGQGYREKRTNFIRPYLVTQKENRTPTLQKVYELDFFQ